MAWKIASVGKRAARRASPAVAAWMAASASPARGVPSPAPPRKRSSSLGGKALEAPAVGLTRIEQAIVQPVGAPLPEFETLGPEAITAPVCGARRCVAMASARRFHGALERSAIRNALALRRGPCGEACAERSSGEVSVGLRRRNALDCAVDAQLALEL